MKGILVFVLICCVISNFTFGQKWTYNSGNNPFDGNFVTSSIIGIGGKYPDNKPILKVNHFENNNHLNIYLIDVGYAGCDNKIAYIKFDNESKIYTLPVLTNSDRDAWFLDFSIIDSPLTILELLKNLKTQNKVFIRISSDCGKSDLEFSLLGSTVAIDYILADYNKCTKRINELESSGNQFKAIAAYNASIMINPDPSELYNDHTLRKGEEIILSKYSEDFYIIHKATSFDLPKDLILYVKKSCFEPNSVVKIN